MPGKKYQIIERIDDEQLQALGEELEGIEFRQSVLTGLRDKNFIDCRFVSCNLSNAFLTKSKLQDVAFKDCKLVGINFFETLDFGFLVEFDNCLLDYASFDKKKLSKSVFLNCRMHGVNFVQTDLSKASMQNCDLLRAVFENTNISGIDFTSNYNFNIDPSINLVKKTQFSSSQLAGLLTRFDLIIH